jgi:tetratricopeptide (TPR) repeat protein
MATRWPRLVLILGSLTGLVLASTILRARETNYPLPPATERLLYLQSGKVADRLALSFDAVAADIYWIRTIQHYGRDNKNVSRENRYELLYPLLDLTTTLDPQFLIAYRFGSMFLASSPPDGPGRVDQALALLEKGLAANPDRWQIAQDVAFTHYLYTGDFAQAAAWFKRAADMPNGPKWLLPLAATTAASGGNRAGARQLLEELLTSEEAYIRQAAGRILEQLGALDQVDQLMGAVRLFRERHARNPADWDEMARAGIIRGPVLDRYGVPFALDPNTGVVSIGPSSPLLPLPPTLKPR